MVDEKTRFHTAGASWAERASLGGLQAVLSPTGEGHRNAFLHGVHSYGAALASRYLSTDGFVIDFGCGNGRFVGFFTSKGHSVLGTEITWAMAAQAKSQYSSDNCEFVITNGISIPVQDNSIGGIWCCSVLRYSLLVDEPCYSDIATEMFRVLRPGAYVVNCEMYVDVPPKLFTQGFEQAGFRTRLVAVLYRDKGFFERCLSNRRIPEKWLTYSAAICAALRRALDNPNRDIPGLRDYLFIWQKAGGTAKKSRLDPNEIMALV